MITLLRPGDWVVLIGASAAAGWLALVLWSGDQRAERVLVRQGGAQVAQLDLRRDQYFTVRGPLGLSSIEIKNGRVRVARDPSPRQYCVQQGWLTRAGETALCLPNQVSVQIAGAAHRYDSLNY